MAKPQSLLAYVFYADGVLNLLFGLVSWYVPLTTYGSIVDLAQLGNPLMLSALSSLSVFYVLIGLVCFIAARTAYPHNISLASVMLLGHTWINIEGVLNIGSEWLIGNPYQDIFIHSAFTIFYGAAIYFQIRNTWNVKD